MLTSDYIAVNNTASTRKNNVIDITFVSLQLINKVRDWEVTELSQEEQKISDHKLIQFKLLRNKDQRVMKKQTWNFDNNKWDEFKENVEDRLDKFYHKLDTNTKALNTTTLFFRAAKETLGTKTVYQYACPWWDRQLKFKQRQLKTLNRAIARLGRRNSKKENHKGYILWKTLRIKRSKYKKRLKNRRGVWKKKYNNILTSSEYSSRNFWKSVFMGELETTGRTENLRLQGSSVPIKNVRRRMRTLCDHFISPPQPIATAVEVEEHNKIEEEIDNTINHLKAYLCFENFGEREPILGEEITIIKLKRLL